MYFNILTMSSLTEEGRECDIWHAIIILMDIFASFFTFPPFKPFHRDSNGCFQGNQIFFQHPPCPTLDIVSLHGNKAPQTPRLILTTQKWK